MMTYFRRRFGDDRLLSRLAWAILALIVLFALVTVSSYYLLPEGVLRGRNPLQSWDESGSVLMLAVRIFGFNMLSVAFIAIGSLFASRPNSDQPYLSTGYYAYYTLIVVNAVTLGTWSFGVASEVVPLGDRLIGMLDVLHRAGLWEMMGQLVVTCSLAQVALVRTTGKVTATRGLHDVSLSPGEKRGILIGFGLMLIGAVVESLAING